MICCTLISSVIGYIYYLNKEKNINTGVAVIRDPCSYFSRGILGLQLIVNRKMQCIRFKIFSSH